MREGACACEGVWGYTFVSAPRGQKQQPLPDASDNEMYDDNVVLLLVMVMVMIMMITFTCEDIPHVLG